MTKEGKLLSILDLTKLNLFVLCRSYLFHCMATNSTQGVQPQYLANTLWAMYNLGHGPGSEIW